MIILYYAPKADHSGIDSHWLYGRDLMAAIKILHMGWKFLELQGLSRQELKLAYHSADCLLRATRHNGYSYCVQEALHYGLPVLHTYPIPGVILIKPEIKDIEEKLCTLQSAL